MSTVHTRPYRGTTNEWITPKWVVDALGPFDLDPCAHPEQPWPLASRQYTVEDDGLSQPWEGRVWLNSPYGPEVGTWLRRLADHGNGIAIVFARTETAWFREQVWSRADGILLLHGRLHFCYPNGERAAGNSGGPLCLVAYGPQNIGSLRHSGLAGTLLNSWDRVPHA